MIDEYDELGITDRACSTIAALALVFMVTLATIACLH